MLRVYGVRVQPDWLRWINNGSLHFKRNSHRTKIHVWAVFLPPAVKRELAGGKYKDIDGKYDETYLAMMKVSQARQAYSRYYFRVRYTSQRIC